MAQKVYELIQFRATEARWELPEEELKSIGEQRRKALEEVGGKTLAGFQACSSKWSRITVRIFPDMEAYHKFHMTYSELRLERYWDFDITLGFEPPA